MTMEPANETTRLPDAVHRRGVSVDAFNPLLRSLLSWELVEQREDEDGGHHWVLIEDAQRRLDILMPRPREASAVLAYLDHWCANCRQQRLTHLLDGRYLCEACQRAAAVGSGTVPTAKLEPKHRHAHEMPGRLRARRS
ncbi:MAG: hypothetical protein ACYCSF_03745 [Acidimicrobiales bacterium]